MGIWRIARKRIWVGVLFVSFFVLSHWYGFIIHEKSITCESLGFILINVIFWLFFVFFLCSYGIWIWSTWISLSSNRICFLFNYVSQSEPLGIVLYIELSFQLFCGKRWNDKYKSIAIIIGDFFTYCKAFFLFPSLLTYETVIPKFVYAERLFILSLRSSLHICITANLVSFKESSRESKLMLLLSRDQKRINDVKSNWKCWISLSVRNGCNHFLVLVSVMMR